MKVFNLNIETLKQFSDLTKLPKIAQYSPKGQKLIAAKYAKWRKTQKRKADSLYKKNQKQYSDPTQAPKQSMYSPIMKDLILNIETQKQFSDLTPTPTIEHTAPKAKKKDLKIGQYQKS